MAVSKWMAAAGAAAFLLAGCDVSIGGKHGEEDGKTEGAKSADGKAEEGKFSIDTPGFKMKLDIPEALTDRAEIDSDSEIIYPGAKMSGMHIEAGEGESSDNVELRFTSGDAPAKLADWYRSGDRSDKFSITSAKEEEGGYTLVGKEKDDDDPFTLRLRPRDGGGTDARLTLQDRD